MHKNHEKWLKKYLENCQQHNLSIYTLKNYECDLRAYLDWLERRFDLYLPRVKSTHIGEYKKHMSGEDYIKPIPLHRKFRQVMRGFLLVLFAKIRGKDGIKPRLAEQKIKGRYYSITTRKRHLSAISNFHSFLCEYYSENKRLFKENPVKQKLHGIKLKEEDVENTKLLTRQDWKALNEYTWRPREKMILFLLYYAGLRLSEVVSLKFSDFNREAGLIRVRRKGGYIHKLVVQEKKRFFAVFDTYQNSCRPNQEFLFPGKSGMTHLTSKAMYNYLINLFERAECPTEGLAPHSFRKACASNLYKKTKDLLLVRDYLNHKDAKVTQTYIERV